MHEPFLQLALKSAESRRGFCSPNPAVGAVVVKNNRVLAAGTHFAAGHPHAEVEALQALSAEEARGATLYVTLEPCCHHGRTPPCTDFIVQRGIREVIFGYEDPNPKVAGQGQKILQAAGIYCQQMPLATIDEFYRSYAHWVRHRLPWVTAKLAMSIDAKIAGKEGEPIAITGESLAEFTHEKRLKSDAILTTANTIVADNPRLNVRRKGTAEIIAKPIYILDRGLKLPLNARVISTAQTLTIFYDEALPDSKLNPFKSLGIRCVPVATQNQKLDLSQVIARLGEDGVHDLWSEAGGRCFQALIAADLIQQGFLYLGATLLGPEAWPAFRDASNIFEKAKHVHWEPHGADVLCRILW